MTILFHQRVSLGYFTPPRNHEARKYSNHLQGRTPLINPLNAARPPTQHLPPSTKETEKLMPLAFSLQIQA